MIGVSATWTVVAARRDGTQIAQIQEMDADRCFLVFLVSLWLKNKPQRHEGHKEMTSSLNSHTMRRLRMAPHPRQARTSSDCEIRVIREGFVLRHSPAHQVQYQFDQIAKTADVRLSMNDLRIRL